MKRASLRRVYLIAFFCVLITMTGCISSTRNESDSELLSVVAISRHGIRSPTVAQDTLNLYTQRPQGFPQWTTPANTAGYLSTVGQQNAARLGVWYRDFYAAEGLLPSRGTCPAAETVFVYADLVERTMQTAKGYLDGLFLGEATTDCGFPVNHTNKLVDPYINTTFALPDVCSINTSDDLIAFRAKISDNPATLISTYSAQLQMLQDVTQCCQLSLCVTTANPTPTSCTLLDLPTTYGWNREVAFTTGSLFDVADTLTETFELEYGQGMPDANCAQSWGVECVGWGKIPAGGISDMSKLHVLNMVNLTCQLPSFSQVVSTNLMWQLVGTMDQTLTGVRNVDMLAPVASKFTMFVAHDEQVSAIAGFLGGATWTANGFQPNDPGPAGALVFELRKLKQSGEYIVRLYYVIASLDQMRKGATLSLQNPPQRLALSIPACGGLTDCPYEQFKTFVTSNVSQSCIVPTAASANRLGLEGK